MRAGKIGAARGAEGACGRIGGIYESPCLLRNQSACMTFRFERVLEDLSRM